MKRKRQDDEKEEKGKKVKLTIYQDRLTLRLGRDCTRHILSYCSRGDLHGRVVSVSKAMRQYVREFDERLKTLVLVTPRSDKEAKHRRDWSVDLVKQLAQVPNLTDLTLFEHNKEQVEAGSKLGQVTNARQWKKALLPLTRLSKFVWQACGQGYSVRTPFELRHRCYVLTQCATRWTSLTDLTIYSDDANDWENDGSFSLAVAAFMPRLEHLSLASIPIPLVELGWMFDECQMLTTVRLNVCLNEEFLDSDFNEQCTSFVASIRRFLTRASNLKYLNLALTTCYESKFRSLQQWIDYDANGPGETGTRYVSTCLGLLADESICKRLMDMDLMVLKLGARLSPMISIDDSLGETMSYQVWDIVNSQQVLTRFASFTKRRKTKTLRTLRLHFNTANLESPDVQLVKSHAEDAFGVPVVTLFF